MLPYRDFTFPLNVFMHMLTLEEGGVSALHYGLFENGETLPVAQERSNALLLSRLPPAPATLLEVGIGLGQMLERLTQLGYEVEGITPSAHEIAMAPAALRIRQSAFEHYERDTAVDVIVFQESSQYIDSAQLFARARVLGKRVLVLDEFALAPLDPPGLHALDRFLAAAEREGFRVVEEVDLSRQAAPTISYFATRFPRHRRTLIDDLGITDAQVELLIDNGERYRARYDDGTYGYRLLDFVR